MAPLKPTRRSILQAIAVAVAARGWEGCSSSSGGAGPAGDAGLDGGVSGDLPWSVWKAMREAVRASPDSLADRAAALVAAKDAQGLFTLVRDGIATLPTPSYATEKSTRWGPRGTLRGGAGSARDRAELLASLLQQAGFQASVVSGIPDNQSSVNAVYLRSIVLPFSPGAPPPALGSSWVSALGGSDAAPPALDLLDPQGAQAKALFDTLNAVLPASTQRSAGPFVLFNVPLVALQQGGATVYLNPLLPTAAFGEAHATQIAAAPPADPTPTMQATLLVARANDPETQIPLVTATYPIDELVGRQLFVATQPAGSLTDLIGSSLSSLAAFVPALSVAGADVTPSERATLTTTGPWVTQSGDILSVAPNGTVTVNGLSVGKGSGTSPSSVASVQVTQVNAGAFPQIELAVSALDGNGKPVVGLGAQAFQVSEDGAAVPFLVRDNGVTAPRVLFLVSTVGGQPPISTSWADAVAQALFAAAPGAAVQVVPYCNAIATSAGYGITDAASLSSALSGLSGSIGGVVDPMWQAILAGQVTNPTLIVLMNDGVGDDANLRAQAMSSLPGGPPVLSVACDVSSSDLTTMQAIATASGGVGVDAGALADATIVTTPLSKMLQARTSAPYRLSYIAPTQGPSTRAVTVTANVSGNGTYTVPAMPSPGGAVVGVYLQLTLTHAVTSHTESYTRVLGGHVPGTDLTVAGAIDAAIADARATMLGAAIISFEGAAPSLSAWVADSLTWRLATETAANAFLAGDAKGGFSALADVPTTFPQETMALHPAPLAPSVPNAVVFEQWLRAVLFRVRPKDPPFHADILPFTRFTTAGPSPTTDGYFRTTLLASLRMAVAESAAFKTSTVSLLQGKQLTLLQPGTIPTSQLAQFPSSQVTAFAYVLNQYTDWFRLVATDGSTLAFWAVHGSTGSALGVLPDGSGGGESPCSNYNQIEKFLDLLALLADVLGVPCLSVWAELGRLVALAGVEAILAFNGMSLPGVSPDNQLQALTCSFGSAALGGIPMNDILGIKGASTIGVNLLQGTTIGKLGQYGAGCPSNPCGG
jgi:hypothetical protein